MMNFVQQQEDLYDFDDQSLANELQSGMRGYHPMVVAAEIQRRLKERNDAQQQMMAQQAQQNQPVAQRQLMEFMAQGQPAEMAPEMMPPEMAMQGGMEGMPPEMMAAAMPPQMPAEAPVGIAAGMPQQMAEGGIVRRAQTGLSGGSMAQDFLAARRRELEKQITRARMRNNQLEAQRLTDELQALLPGSGKFSSPAFQGARDLSDITSRMTRPPVIPQGPEFDLTLPQDRQAVAPDEVPADLIAETRETPTGRGVTSLPTYSPTSFDFGGAYQRNLADLELQPVTIRSPRATEQSIRDASFFTEERGRLGKFAPDKERFQRESQSDLLVGLGSVIAGATQRGDIAKGLSQLAAQQREARRGFRQEEREYEGLASALRREERGERRELERERRQIEREDEAAAAGRRKEAREITALELAAEERRQEAQYKVQDLARQLEALRVKAERDSANAQLKLVMDTVTMQLRQAQTELARAETEKKRAEAAAAARYASTGTSASQVRSATSGGQ
jgi:hypothetical protein